MNVRYIRIPLQNNDALKQLLCTLVAILGIAPLLYCLLWLKDDKLSSVTKWDKFGGPGQGEELAVCSLIGRNSDFGLAGPHGGEAEYQARLERCARYISKLMTENDDNWRTVEKVAINHRQQTLQRADDNLPLDSLSNGRLRDSEKNTPMRRLNACRQHNCFDYSRCPLTSSFRVYFYSREAVLLDQMIDRFVVTSVTDVMKTNPYVSRDRDAACVCLVLVGGWNISTTTSATIKEKLSKLPSWRGTGQNHVLLNLGRGVLISSEVLRNVDSDRAIVAQSSFDAPQFRPGFDIVTPLLLVEETSYVWKETPRLTPAKRKYLLSFQGTLPPHVPKLSAAAKRIQKELGQLKEVKVPGSEFYFELNCPPVLARRENAGPSEWWLCAANKRSKILKLSTFVLIVTPDESDVVSSTMLQVRLHEALKHGAVPVVLGERTGLPFSEYIAWEMAAVALPKARLTELPNYLSSIHEADILSLRNQGWLIWTTYLSSTAAVINGILAVLRTRLSMHPNPVPKAPSPTVVRVDLNTTEMKKVAVRSYCHNNNNTLLSDQTCREPSPQYLHNFTYSGIARESSWHSFPGPFGLFPSTPSDPGLPLDALMGPRKALGKSMMLAEVFRNSLWGNAPTEQFTVIILTYDRLPQLLGSLRHLMGLPFLHKVLVVWNFMEPPSSDIVWPSIHVPIKIIKPEKNSLNNRFLPYDEVETDAIFSLDDDIKLTHDEIVFAFRVWRENRDRIVGFPGRHHTWDVKRGFRYRSIESCELSMVLTGAAFFHRYYTYLYSYTMPKAIRDKVDKHMNCEDIAMNFLVSHITRKPPIKVTGNTDFICRSCSKELSRHRSHYSERSRCIQFFSKVYGYTPLLYTQFRADTVLYRHWKEHCYKNL